jgi:molybdenum cofactor guanylyltransferase|tara:strand:- start:182 stop:787 length:606 start_codon:yes stop_codon:yes gene_type:complete
MNLNHTSKSNPTICALILAGGQGTRMAHQEKGLALLLGRALIGHVIDRIKPQVDRLLINCNRHSLAYQQFGYPLIEDNIMDFSGPLRGILSARASLGEDLCFVVPCDMPRLPLDVVQRLHVGLQDHDAAYVVAAGQTQPLVLLLKPHVISQIDPYLISGRRSVKGWLRMLDTVKVDFDNTADFNNINDFDQLATAANQIVD